MASSKHAMPPIDSLPGDSQSAPKPPSTARRLVALVVGPAVLIYAATILSLTNGISFTQVVPWVLIGGLVIAAVLALLAVRLVHCDGTARQFSLSTLLLIAVPLGIQLSGVRAFWIPLISHEPGPHWSRPIAVIILCGISMLWMFVCTVILLCFAEAVVWLMLKVQRKRAVARTNQRRRAELE